MPTGSLVAGGTRRQAAAAATANPQSVVQHEIIVDRQTRAFSAAADTNGIAVAAMPPPASGYSYRIEILRISAPGTGATFGIYLGDYGQPDAGVFNYANELDFSTDGNNDIAYETPPIYVPPGVTPYLVWAALAPTAQATARVQWAVTQFVPLQTPLPS